MEINNLGMLWYDRNLNEKEKQVEELEDGSHQNLSSQIWNDFVREKFTSM